MWGHTLAPMATRHVALLIILRGLVTLLSLYIYIYIIIIIIVEFILMVKGGILGLHFFTQFVHVVSHEWWSRSGGSTTPPLTTCHISKL